MSTLGHALLIFPLVGCATHAPSADISRGEPIGAPEPAAPSGVTAAPLASVGAPVVTRDARDCSVEFRERLEAGGPSGRIEAVACLPRETDDQCTKRAEGAVTRAPSERIVAVMTGVKPTSVEAEVEVDNVVEHWLASDATEIAMRATARAKSGSKVKLLRTTASKTGQRQVRLLLSGVEPLAPSPKTRAHIQWRPELDAPAALTEAQSLANALGVTIVAYTPLDTGGLEITVECGG